MVFVKAATGQQGSLAATPVDVDLPQRRVEIWTITPERAQEMLCNRRDQREPPSAMVGEFAEAMKAGLWAMDGAPIHIGWDNRLLNGVKRLFACVRAGVPFDAVVVLNCDPRSWDTIDNVHRRKLAHIFHTMDKNNERSLATMLGIVWRARKGRYDAAEKSAPDLVLLALNEQYKGIEWSLAFANSLRGRRTRLPRAAALHFLFSQVDRHAADRFFKAVCQSNGLGEAEPERLLHDRLTNMYDTQDQVAPLEEGAAVIAAWNARHEGKRIKARDLRWTEDGAVPFPVIAGWTEDCNLSVDVRPSGNVMRLASATPAAPVSGQEASARWPNVRIEQVMMTPALAVELMGRNERNRPRSSATVDKYGRDLLSGAWNDNAQPVRVAWTGRLLDGQHRLQAIINTGVTIPMIVIYGLEEDSFEVMDRGGAKRFKDALTNRGVANAGAVAAACRLYMLWTRYDLGKRPHPMLSVPELDRTLADHPGLATTTLALHHLRRRMIPAAAMAVEYRLRELSPEKAASFFDALITGENLSKGDPRLVLRDVLGEMYVRTDGGGGGAGRGQPRRTWSPDPGEQIALCVMAWNAFVAGKKLTAAKLKWDREAPFPELAVAK